MMYTINAESYKKVENAFNRYAKKASKIGLECSLTIIKEYQKRVPVFAVDEINHCVVNTRNTAIIDVMDIDVVFPEYKLGNYNVIAVLEHIDDGKNMVYPCGNHEVPTKYNTAPGRCEHCNTNHRRVKTVVVKDIFTEEYKQIGTGCLKEYTGVDDTDLVNAYIALDSIILENESDRGYFGTPEDKYTETLDYLAKCIHVYNEKGYNKENKYKAEKVKDCDVTDTDINLAKTVIDFFDNNEYTDTFLNNIKVAVTQMFTKRYNGFIAYAYVAYIKELEKIAKEKVVNEIKATITYFGTVGEKIKGIEVTGRCVAGYETQFGYTYVYKFTDDENHVFVWKTGNCIDTDDNGTFTGTINGTIKAHNEYNGEKQTVLTRCRTKIKETA